MDNAILTCDNFFFFFQVCFIIFIFTLVSRLSGMYRLQRRVNFKRQRRTNGMRVREREGEGEGERERERENLISLAIIS